MKKYKIGGVIACLALTLAACSTDEDTETSDSEEEAASPIADESNESTDEAESAVANITGLADDSEITATANFTKDEDGKVTLNVSAEGLTEGEHGFHIHENPSCEADGDTPGGAAGGHWNPEGMDHGAPNADPSHLGDTGNLVAAEDGTATLEVSIEGWTLGDGADTDVIGHSMIVHANQDDFEGESGNAGPRVACGIIE